MISHFPSQIQERIEKQSQGKAQPFFFQGMYAASIECLFRGISCKSPTENDKLYKER